MGEAYFKLKRKLEELGYNNLLPVDGVPLVECVIADLLQTTRSLQHYMDLSKEALMQRDSLMLEAEPYKCDNAKLIQENNHLHRENIRLKEENVKLTKEMRRKIKSLSDEMMRKDSTITKLQHELRDMSLRGLCADTMSTRLKSKRKDTEASAQTCSCLDRKPRSKEVEDLNKIIEALEEKAIEYKDEIVVLKIQVEHRDNEIIRLNMLLEGGRPLTAINKDCCNPSTNNKLHSLMKELHDLEASNVVLKKEIDSSLEKQHEAMLRALTLADKNKALQEEIKKVDTLALRVEEDCNKRLSELINEVNFLQSRIEGLTMKNTELERQLSNHSSGKTSGSLFNKLQESVNVAKKENDALQKEIKDLVELNKGLQDKILTLSNSAKSYDYNEDAELKENLKKCPTKEELQSLLERERIKYEKNIKDLQVKMSETMDTLSKHMLSCRGDSPKIIPKDNSFVRDLHTKLCEKEQKILMLKKEIDDLRSKLDLTQEGNKQNYKDIISQLNIENSELSKENIALSQQVSHMKNMNSGKSMSRGDYTRREVERLKDTIIRTNT